MDWQPIETIPETGKVDLWNASAKCRLADVDCFAGVRDMLAGGNFTHWMPIPGEPDNPVPNGVSIQDVIADARRFQTLLDYCSMQYDGPDGKDYEGIELRFVWNLRYARLWEKPSIMDRVRIVLDKIRGAA